MGRKGARRIRIAKGLSLNVSRSGISASAKVGRVTLNSRRGVTANIAKGVSVNAPIRKSVPRSSVAARNAPRTAAAAPSTSGRPRTFRRPFGRFPGWLYWTVGIVAAVLFGAIPYVGPLVFLLLLCAMIATWLKTPQQLVTPPETTAVSEAVVAPTDDPE